MPTRHPSSHDVIVSITACVIARDITPSLNPLRNDTSRNNNPHRYIYIKYDLLVRIEIIHLH